MVSKTETETSVVYDHIEGVYRVWTNYRPHIAKFDREDRALVVDRGEDWAQYLVPANQFDIRKGFKSRRTYTAEERAEMARTARERFGHTDPAGD